MRRLHGYGFANGLRRAGSFKQPLFKEGGTTCVGLETVDGTKYYADKVVLATGAWSPALVDLEDQCCSKVSMARTLYGEKNLLIANIRPGYMP